jgi:NADH-quinone oxidoreductase subunit J
MMLDINYAEMRKGFLQYLPIGGIVGLILFVELVLVVGTWAAAPETVATAGVPLPPPEQVHNTKAIGNVIYTDYIYLFQAAGLVLLVAMVGAIVLTLRQREGVRKQSIAGQVGRRRADSVELKDMPSGSGV